MEELNSSNNISHINPISTRDKVNQICRQLVDEGQNITVDKVYQLLGNKGSKSTIHDQIKRWREQLSRQAVVAVNPNVPNDLQDLFLQFWEQAIHHAQLLFSKERAELHELKQQQEQQLTQSQDLITQLHQSLEQYKKQEINLIEQLNQQKTFYSEQKQAWQEQSQLLQQEKMVTLQKVEQLEMQYNLLEQQTKKEQQQQQQQFKELEQLLSETRKDSLLKQDELQQQAKQQQKEFNQQHHNSQQKINQQEQELMSLYQEKTHLLVEQQQLQLQIIELKNLQNLQNIHNSQIVQNQDVNIKTKTLKRVTTRVPKIVKKTLKGR